MTIRPITKDDIGACAQVYMKAYKPAPWNYNWHENDAIQYIAEHFDTPHMVGFVLCEGDEIAATILTRKKTWWTGNQLYIDELFVSADHQRKGYGKKLLEHVSEYAKQNGINIISLMTNKYMPAYQFYLNNDFIGADQFTVLFKMIV